jgi:hypothetical protein
MSGMKLSQQPDNQREEQADRRVGPIVDKVINWGLVVGAVIAVLFLLGTAFVWFAGWYLQSAFTDIPR